MRPAIVLAAALGLSEPHGPALFALGFVLGYVLGFFTGRPTDVRTT